MTSAELDTLVAEKLGVRRHVVRRDLAVLAGGLRPGERVLTLGLADRGLLLGGGRVVAATDQRLLMASASSGCRELAYDALVAVTDDAAAGEVALVTRDEVHTLKIAPPERAAELVSAISARIDTSRIHPRAGGEEARRAQKALVGAVVCVVAVIGGNALRGELQLVVDRRGADRPGLEELATGRCLDLQGAIAGCGSDDAMFVVLGRRDMPRCPGSSPTLAASLARTPAARRELLRWCIDVKGPRDER